MTWSNRLYWSCELATEETLPVGSAWARCWCGASEVQHRPGRLPSPARFVASNEQCGLWYLPFAYATAKPSRKTATAERVRLLKAINVGRRSEWKSKLLLGRTSLTNLDFDNAVQ